MSNNIDRFNADGTLDAGFNQGTGVNGFVMATAFQNGKVIIGGNFTSYNNITRTGIARINTASNAVADYDGDGRSDISIFRPSNGQWWLNRSSQGVFVASFGNGSDKLTPSDFTGDGKTDMAFFRPATGEWFILRSEDSSFYSFPFGANGDIPAAGDFDGDGRTDAAVFRPNTGVWYLLRSQAGFTAIQFGLNGDIPTF